MSIPTKPSKQGKKPKIADIEKQKQQNKTKNVDFVARVLSLTVQESPLKIYFRLREDKKMRGLF